MGLDDRWLQWHLKDDFRWKWNRKRNDNEFQKRDFWTNSNTNSDVKHRPIDSNQRFYNQLQRNRILKYRKLKLDPNQKPTVPAYIAPQSNKSRPSCNPLGFTNELTFLLWQCSSCCPFITQRRTVQSRGNVRVVLNGKIERYTAAFPNRWTTFPVQNTATRPSKAARPRSNQAINRYLDTIVLS